MLMPLTVAETLLLPALSVQVPVVDCPAPSVFNTTVSHVLMSDVVSVPVKVIVTAWLYQLFWSGARSGFPTTSVGGVASRLIVGDVALAVRPALLVQEPLKITLVVSFDKT